MSRKIYLLILIVIFVSSAQASGILDSSKSAMYEITGKVRLVGNEPFSQLVITDEKGKDYIIQKEYRSTFKNLLHKEVTVSAKIVEDTLHSADGKYTIIRYFLIDPVIIVTK